MDINAANMEVFKQQLSVAYRDAFNAARENALVGTVATVVPSTGKQTVHGWMNQLPAMREWVGDRVWNNVQSGKLTVVNRKFESGFEMEREEIEDDLHGLYTNNATVLGANAAAFPDELIVEALLRGQITEWADETAVFSDSRTFGAATIDNLGTAAFDAAGTALMAAYKAMVSYRGHSGKPLMVRPRYLIHGPAIRDKVIQALASQYTALLAPDGTTYVGQGGNPTLNLVTPIECPYLIDGYVDSKETSHNAADYWFVVGTVGGLLPLAYQDRVKPEIQDNLMRTDSEYAVTTDKMRFGVRMRGEAFVALPFGVFGSFAS